MPYTNFHSFIQKTKMANKECMQVQFHARKAYFHQRMSSLAGVASSTENIQTGEVIATANWRQLPLCFGNTRVHLCHVSRTRDAAASLWCRAIRLSLMYLFYFTGSKDCTATQGCLFVWCTVFPGMEWLEGENSGKIRWFIDLFPFTQTLFHELFKNNILKAFYR